VYDFLLAFHGPILYRFRDKQDIMELWKIMENYLFTPHLYSTPRIVTTWYKNIDQFNGVAIGRPKPGIHTGDKVEFNTVDFAESRLLPKPATNRQQSRLLPIRSTLSPVCTGPKQHGRLCPLSTNSTVLNSTYGLAPWKCTD